ncbi:hypothetical protein WBW39_21370, partial [Pectobacterium versatile]
INFHRVIGTTRVTKTSLNAAKLDPEQLRRQDLRKLGMKEISIKRTESPEKGWLDFRGIITTC